MKLDISRLILNTGKLNFINFLKLEYQLLKFTYTPSYFQKHFVPLLRRFQIITSYLKSSYNFNSNILSRNCNAHFRDFKS